MDYREQLARALEEIEHKRMEAEMHDRLARICRDQSAFRPIYEERPLTPEEEQRARELADEYNTEMERYKRHKGWAV